MIYTTQCENESKTRLDTNNKLNGDYILVVRDRDPTLKFAYSTAFTNKAFDSSISTTNNALRPQYLIGTLGYIGVSLDCSDVQLVLHLGLYTNIINFIQEMERCGQIPNNNQLEPSYTNEFNIVFSIQNFVHIHKRIHDNENHDTQISIDKSTNNQDLVVSREYIKDSELRNYMIQ